MTEVPRFDARVAVYDAWPPLYESLFELTLVVHRSGLEPKLLQLVQIRTSQLNGCTYCLDLHVGFAKRAGEADHRLHTVAAWRDADWFTDAEKAALALTEAVAVLGSGGPSDAIVDEVRRHFADDGLAKLLLVIASITAWNLVNVTAKIRIGGDAPPSS